MTPHPDWIEAQLARLIALHQQGRLPHALLICGAPGWGQELLADALARALLEIDSELPLAAIAHQDLRWLVPDKANIPVELIRDVAAFAVGTRQVSPSKVAVLTEAHTMAPAAANALLKTLEEPPAETYLLLVSEYGNRLLPTIRSRCTHVRLRPDPKAASIWLQARYGQDARALQFEYGGAPIAVADALAAGETPLAEALTEALDTGRIDPLYALIVTQATDRVLLRWLRYVVAAVAGGGPVASLQRKSARSLLAFQDELVNMHRQFVTSNSVNHKLQLERLCHRCIRLEPMPEAAGVR